ncbi:sensor histidine kinase [Uliginosibacterium gangwonense]|uniref:sensor histidine kinase n=1 Tax=Uliginosibacterium gangwonense TaxID=392736 RepID=UPI000369BC5C|nr:ATP-binding protein [Uliginosibacterium gangwonense]
MTIRKTLLRAFLLVGVVPAILLAALTFVKAREAMQAEIDHGLASQADAIASDINKILFERLQNAATWSSLDVAQDLQVQDVDKRFSNFLAKLKNGYGGVYRELYAIGRNGQIIASSEPAKLGQRLPTPTPAWRSLSLAGAQLTLNLPQHVDKHASLTIRAPIASQFANEHLGELVLEYDWSQIDAMLDRSATGGRMIALIDTRGQVYAASTRLRETGLLNGKALAEWLPATQAAGAFTHTGGPVWHSSVLVGVGRPQGFAGFPGLGLSVLVIQPLDEALAPIHRMAIISLSILAALLIATLAAASWVSGAIARPIVALTNFTRQYKNDSSTQMALPAATGEVEELGKAFAQMIRDIEQSRHKLVRASKLAVVGEMSSVIAHEVRTPLGILRSSAQILRRDPGISAESRELTGFIESETERLNRLVSAMLDSARPRALSKTPVDLHQLIHHSSVLLAAQIEKRQIRLSEQLDAANPIIECDAEQITQVLLNLILNGLQILAAGGQIRISTHDSPEQFCIAISDDGPGIPAEERSRIFEAFFFRREGGVGLGLAIVQQIITAHGGDIEADESELGGARFTIRLPRQTQPELKD